MIIVTNQPTRQVDRQKRLTTALQAIRATGRAAWRRRGQSISTRISALVIFMIWLMGR